MNYYEPFTRPSFITNQDLKRWDQIISQDSLLKEEYKRNFQIREYCYAGIWLFEQLMLSSCPVSLAKRIQYFAGKNSINKNPWEIHQESLSNYENDKLDIKSSQINN